ncbi:6-bladed beta-propeller [Roseivirga misakiensis]|uniref:6-bladed beta-propeller n=1 Tax=Roseivirga misakiensis TaxID=1563681 RepID=A0A1E5T251_9BACT|nr:6-bladed beta-propeller [Roseivirga misakiensis]OEK05455.1 hypothetical protein BFP71_18910 [Roseivirga misakiensis]
MKQVLFVLCFSTFLLILGCSRLSKEKEPLLRDLDEFKSYVVDVEESLSPIWDAIEKVEILKLEETQESFLSNFYNISKLGNDFVLGDPKNGSLFIYGPYGEFKRRISNQGAGPEEYSFLLNSWVEDDIIGVFDATGMRIHNFNVNGEHLGSKKLPYSPNEMAFWDGKYYLDVSTQKFDNNRNFSILILNEDMSLSSESIPLKYVKPFGVFWRSPFIAFGDHLTYHDAISDTVFIDDNGGFRPLLSLCFGDKWAWKDQELLSDRSKANVMLKRKGFVNKFQALVGPEYIFVQYYWGGKIQAQLINRFTSDTKRLDLRNSKKENYSIDPYYWDNDMLLVSIQSTDVAEFIENGLGEKVELKGTTLQEIESSENPVLAWISFK